MTSQQIGWYILLLSYCWQEAGLPEDRSRWKPMARVQRTGPTGQTSSGQTSSDEFTAVEELFNIQDEHKRWWHHKLLKQQADNQLTMDARSRGGHIQSRKKRDGRGHYLPGELQVDSRWTPGGTPGGTPGELQVDSRCTPGELQVRASDSVCVSISEFTNNSEKGECEGETAEFDFEHAFQDYVRLYRFPVTRMGSCRAQYHSIVFAGDDPVAKSRALTANLEKWVGWWQRNLRSRKPLGLLNFLADGDCMVEPPDDIVEPVKKTRLQEMMDSI